MQECIAHIFFIFKDAPDSTVVPSFISSGGRNAVTLKPSCYLLTACALQIFTENALHNFCLFRVYNKMSVLILIVPEEAVCIDHDLSLLKTVLDTDLYILTE